MFRIEKRQGIFQAMSKIATRASGNENENVCLGCFSRSDIKILPANFMYFDLISLIDFRRLDLVLRASQIDSTFLTCGNPVHN